MRRPMYPSIPASPDFPEIERGILAFWKKDDTFRASVEQRDGCEEWVFYDGPPFANGLPHYGHLLTGYAKDLFPRFQTMRGKQVVRRFGWDTHGLPAELEAMRQLGITQKHEIEEMGIAAFNAKARETVLRYTERVGGVRHPPGSLGRLRERLQDARRDVHGERHLGVQAAVPEGPRVRGLPGAALLLERRDPALEPRAADGRRRLQDAPGPVGHGHLPPRRGAGRGPRPDRRRGTRLDDDAMDAAHQPRARGRARHPVLGRAAPSTAVHEFLLATDTIGAYLKELGYETTQDVVVASTVTGADLRACATTGCGITTPRSRGARATPGRSWSPTTSRPARAPASCIGRPLTVRTTRSSAARPASR